MAQENGENRALVETVSEDENGTVFISHLLLTTPVLILYLPFCLKGTPILLLTQWFFSFLQLFLISQGKQIAVLLVF